MIEAERDRIKWEKELLLGGSGPSVKRYDDGGYDMSHDNLNRSFDDQNNLNCSFDEQTRNSYKVGNPRYDDNSQLLRSHNEVDLHNAISTENVLSRFTPMSRESPVSYNSKHSGPKKSILPTSRFSPQPSTSHGEQRRTSSPKGKFSPQPSSSRESQRKTIITKDKFSPQQKSNKIDHTTKVSQEVCCSKCKKGGHTAENCTSTLCTKCSEYGHKSKNCFVKSKGKDLKLVNQSQNKLDDQPNLSKKGKTSTAPNSSKDLETKDGNDVAKNKPDLVKAVGNQDWRTCNDIKGVLTRLSPIRATAWKLLESEISKDPSLALKWISSSSDTKNPNKFYFGGAIHLNRVKQILLQHHPNIELDSVKVIDNAENKQKNSPSSKNKKVQEKKASQGEVKDDKPNEEDTDKQDWHTRKHINGVLACLSPVQNTAWVLLELKIVKDPKIFINWLSSINQPDDPQNFFGGLDNVEKIRGLLKKHHPNLKLPELKILQPKPQEPKKLTSCEDIVLSEDSDIEVVEEFKAANKQVESKLTTPKQKKVKKNTKNSKKGMIYLFDLKIPLLQSWISKQIFICPFPFL